MYLGLEGLRVLVVEDEWLLACHSKNAIEAQGGVVIGPLPTVEKGLALLEEGDIPDAAILDIRLKDRLVYELAEVLVSKKVPFVFASAEDAASVPPEFTDVPLLSKPLVIEDAVAALSTFKA